jgi:hypothetical protein
MAASTILSRSTAVPRLRWDPYLMHKGKQFHEFWSRHLGSSDRQLLYVLGRGFDPRMCAGLAAILNIGGDGKRDITLITFDEGPDSPSMQYGSLVAANQQKLEILTNDRSQVIRKPVQMWSTTGLSRHRVASRSAADVFSQVSDLLGYTDVIVDIGAMPRCVYFPLIGKLLYLLDQARKVGAPEGVLNLHVVVCEDPELDRRIRDVGADDNAGYIHGFGGDLEIEATAELPRIWIPSLGEGQSEQLERIHTLINPEEICPILPSPSLDPRRSDDLLLEYRELLFDRWHVEPRNIIYASEQNPFDAYRQIHRAVRHYDRALHPLGGCKTVVSAQTSKLLSIGTLLAAYELKQNAMSIGLAHVEAQGYEVSSNINETSATKEGELFTLWLAGECYEP